MKVINDLNLPEAIYKALSRDDYIPLVDSVSVTEIINPIKYMLLNRRHGSEIEENASDRMWVMIGNAVHKALSEVEVENSLTEERLSVEVDGVTVSGKADMYHLETLWDYKYTSAWSIAFEPEGRKEWARQLNLYAYLYKQAGFPVKAIKNACFLRDWSKNEMLGNDKYPRKHIVVLEHPLLLDNYALEFIKSKVGMFKAYHDVDDDLIPECEPEDRWERATTWAIIKEGNKKATKVCRSKEEADEFLATCKPGFRIEMRPGRCVRCLDYCPVRKFCHFGKELEE